MEPITADPVRPVRALLSVSLRDVAFLHWPVDPRAVAPLLPPGVAPDVFGGTSYAGLVALRMHRVRPPGLPALPYLGSFPQVNVRLYGVGADGRRGVVFRSMDADRLLPAVAGRAGLRLPFYWATVRIGRHGDVISYLSRRRWPGPAGPGLRLRLRIGEPLAAPSPLEHFLTARWGLHAAWFGQQVIYLPNGHPRWPLHRAEVLELADDLVPAAAVSPRTGDPVSVLYSPGVRMAMGLPQRMPS